MKRFLIAILTVAMLVSLMVPLTFAQEPTAPKITSEMLRKGKEHKVLGPCGLTRPAALMENLAGIVNEPMVLSVLSAALDGYYQFSWMLVYEGTEDSLGDQPVFSDYFEMNSIQAVERKWTPTSTGDYVFVTATTDADGYIYDGSVYSVEFHVGTERRSLKDFTMVREENTTGDTTYDETRVQDNTIYVAKGHCFAGKVQLNPSNTTDARNSYTYNSWGDCVSGYDFDGNILINGDEYGVAGFGLGINGVGREFRVEVCTDMWGHYMKEIRTEPTCEAGGQVAHACAKCGYTEGGVQQLPAAGHKWTLSVTNTAPTVETAGSGVYVCSRCGKSKTDVIPSLTDSFNAFTDIPDNAWYRSAAQYAYFNGLFNGTSTTTFDPDATMTRAMLVTVLWRYEGQPEEGNPTFTDVSADQWFSKAVAWASSKGIVNGVGNQRFDPNATITREQMATILFRYSQYRELETTGREDFSGFADGSQVSGYAVEPMQWCVSQGIINGNTQGGRLYLQPLNGASRGQVAAILMRFIENVVK